MAKQEGFSFRKQGNLDFEQQNEYAIHRQSRTINRHQLPPPLGRARSTPVGSRPRKPRFVSTLFSPQDELLDGLLTQSCSLARALGPSGSGTESDKRQFKACLQSMPPKPFPPPGGGGEGAVQGHQDVSDIRLLWAVDSDSGGFRTDVRDTRKRWHGEGQQKAEG